MKYIMILTILLSSCTNYITKPEAENAYKQIAQAINQQSAYTNLLVNEVYKKQIAACKAKEMGLDLKTGQCMKAPEK